MRKIVFINNCNKFFRRGIDLNHSLKLFYTSKKARSRTGKVFFNCILTINGINKLASKLKRFIL